MFLPPDFRPAFCICIQSFAFEAPAPASAEILAWLLTEAMRSRQMSEVVRQAMPGILNVFSLTVTDET